MSNCGDALERVLLAYPVELLRKQLDFPYTRSGRKAPQEHMKTGRSEAGCLLNLKQFDFCFCISQAAAVFYAHTMHYVVYD